MSLYLVGNQQKRTCELEFNQFGCYGETDATTLPKPDEIQVYAPVSKGNSQFLSTDDDPFLSNTNDLSIDDPIFESPDFVAVIDQLMESNPLADNDFVFDDLFNYLLT